MTAQPHRSMRRGTITALLAFAFVFQTFAQEGKIKAGRYDNGKMWTFEYPPLEYLANTYDFRPDEAWFERARLSVLRIPGCSASFVSPNGLVVTNHHCVRSRVSQVSGPDEGLLDNGFYAPSLEEERRIPGYYADQLIAIEDITDEIYAALDGSEDRGIARLEAINAAKARIEEERSDIEGLSVQIIALYSGGRYSAYIFRRYSDVRLVMAVELQLGLFGGDGVDYLSGSWGADRYLMITDSNGVSSDTISYFSSIDARIDFINCGDTTVYLIGEWDVEAGTWQNSEIELSDEAFSGLVQQNNNTKLLKKANGDLVTFTRQGVVTQTVDDPDSDDPDDTVVIEHL
ncbi:MAG: S46 family peptidase, partial [Bacteroidetes bacterium]|nr:S46 family peptidase [Bacteroidota bacterium]